MNRRIDVRNVKAKNVAIGNRAKAGDHTMPQQETNVASEGFNVLWVTALVNWVAKEVESRYTSDAYRWPVIRFYDADVYQALPSIRLFIIRDKSSGGLAAINAAKEWPSGAQRPDADVLTSPNLLDTVKRLYTDFNVRQQDLLFLLPEDDLNVTDSWNQMSSAQQNALRIQLAYVVRNQFYYVRGFDAMGNFIIPPGYDFLANECKRFLEDHPSYDKNVFLMTRFDSSNRFSVTLDQEVRTVLPAKGLTLLEQMTRCICPTEISGITSVSTCCAVVAESPFLKIKWRMNLIRTSQLNMALCVL